MTVLYHNSLKLGTKYTQLPKALCFGILIMSYSHLLHAKEWEGLDDKITFFGMEHREAGMGLRTGLQSNFVLGVDQQKTYAHLSDLLCPGSAHPSAHPLSRQLRLLLLLLLLHLLQLLLTHSSHT